MRTGSASHDGHLFLAEVAVNQPAVPAKGMGAAEETTMGRSLISIAARVIDRLAGFSRSIRNRRTVAQLLHWDERMLRDIGLTSGDVRAALALPGGEDPSRRLGMLSTERRAAIRAEARERQAFARNAQPKNAAGARIGRASLNPFLDPGRAPRSPWTPGPPV